MSRRKRKPLPQETIELVVEKLSHDGRGIAQINGKKTFVEGALAGETVQAKFTHVHSRFNETRVVNVIAASLDRVTPPCTSAHICGGCSLQHLAVSAQIQLKQQALEEQLQHFGGLVPQEWLPPLTAQTEHYRRKARLGVRYVLKREQMLVGFREKSTNFLADIEQCEVLEKSVGHALQELRAITHSLAAYQTIPQIEVAIGDTQVALVFRHLEALSDDDRQKLIEFGKSKKFDIYLQPGNAQTVHKVWPLEGDDRLTYQLTEFDLTMRFHPTDFTQVNPHINRKMLSVAVNMLDPQPTDRVLDLFCGLGNFTLPLARKSAQVVGVEGDDAMVVRGRENAQFNHVQNVTFFGADLTKDFTKESWAQEGFDKILLDPPRSGALEIVQFLPKFKAKRLVYVSCNPATLARDAGELVKNGYKLKKAGVMDMFPHTTHVESIALFEAK